MAKVVRPGLGALEHELTSRGALNSCHVFLSHRHVDRSVADVLRRWLENLPGITCTVFQSSDTSLQPAGADWRQQIKDNMQAADLLIALFGRTGGDTHWDHINWECSEALALGRRVIPLCHSGVEATELHDRLRPFVALTMEAPAFGQDLVNSLVPRMPGLDAAAVGTQELERALRQALESIPTESLILNLPRLELAAHRLLADSFPPSILLHPHLALLDFAGRDAELEELSQFCRDEAPFRWKIVSGEAGAGKTRLALEFCRKCRDAGWNAGFLDEAELEAFVANGQCDRWNPGRPTLIVVDYAAGKVDPLRHLLRRGARWASEANAGSDEPQIRLVLLERHADREQGWLFELLSKGSTRHVLELALHRTLILSRPPRREDEDPAGYVRRILEDTSNAWGRVTGRPVPTLEGLAELDLRLLQAHTLGRPLYLQMAALHACEIGSFENVSQWGRSELLQAAVERELAYVEREKDPDLHELVLWAVAILCLTGPSVAAHASWRGRLRARIDETGNTRIQPRQVNDALATIFDFRGSRSRRPIEPDLIAEAFVVHVLRHGPNPPAAMLHEALDMGGAEAWRTVLRVVQDLHGLPGHEDIDSWLEPLVRERPLEELRELARTYPERSVSLRRLAVELYRGLLENRSARSIAEPTARGGAEERAWWRSKLALHLERLKRHQHAVVEARRAVAAWNRLAADSDAATDGLAYALYVLSTCLDSVGEGEESLEVVRRAVELRRRLLPEHQPELAKCLNNLGLRLGKADPAAARAALAEAVDRWRSLAAADPAEHAPELARSLNNLAIRLQGLGETGPALEAIQESIAIREEFASRDPDTNGADLLFSLVTHAQILAPLGRHEEIRKITQRYEDVVRELGSRDGRLFVYQLGVLVSLLQGVGMGERALEIASDRVNFARELDSREGSAPPVDLARALLARAGLFARMERGEEAIKETRAAIDLLGRHASRDPATVLPVLGECHLELMDLLSAETEDWREAALRAANLGASLANLASDFFRTELEDEAVMAARAAVAVMEQLARRASGDLISARLALACNNRAYVLHRLGRNEEGLPAARRSCELLQELRQAATDGGGAPDWSLVQRIGECQETLAAILLARGELAAARAAIAHSTNAYEVLLQRAPTERRGVRHAEVVLTQAEILAASKETNAAGHAFTRAIEILMQSDEPLPKESRTRAREAALGIRELDGVGEECLRLAEDVLGGELDPES